METIKSFANFISVGVNPLANVIEFQEFQITNSNKAKVYFKYADNRFFDLCETTPINFEEIERKALELGFVEVPNDIAEILKLGNYWGNLSKIEKYASSAFIQAVKDTTAYDGTPELG